MKNKTNNDNDNDTIYLTKVDVDSIQFIRSYDSYIFLNESIVLRFR